LDGEVRSDILAEAKELAPWIQTRKEAYWGVQPVKNWPSLCKSPVTRKGNTLYIHQVSQKEAHPTRIQLAVKQRPSKASLLGNKEVRVQVVSEKEGLLIKLSSKGLNPLGEVLKLEFRKLPPLISK
jgi:hypothetical protein